MKRILIGALLIGSIGSGFAQNKSIDFEKDFDKALKKAKAENKLVFLDAYASWCGPCKWMSANIFTNDTVADFYNEKFINLKMDMEKGKGKEVAKQMEVRAYPTLFFLDAEGNMVHKKVGASREVQDYIDLGNTAMNPDMRWGALKKKYDSGQKDREFLRQYVEAASSAGAKPEDAVKLYYEGLSDQEMVLDETWQFMKDYDRSVDSKGITFLMANLDRYTSLYDKKEIDDLLYRNNLNHVMGILYQKDFSKRDFDIAIINVKKHKIHGWEKIALTADAEHLRKQGKIKERNELLTLEVMEVFMHDPQALNSYAWDIFKQSDDPSELAEALKWAERSLLMDENSATQDTHANLLYKLGRKEEAISSGKKAIELAKEEGIPTEDYEKALETYK